MQAIEKWLLPSLLAVETNEWAVLYIPVRIFDEDDFVQLQTLVYSISLFILHQLLLSRSYYSTVLSKGKLLFN